MLRRVGPDGTVNFDLVAEVLQRRKAGKNRWMYGGATVILDTMGFIRYVIVKNLASKARERHTNRQLDDHRAFAAHFSDNVPARVKWFRDCIVAGRRKARTETASWDWKPALVTACAGLSRSYTFLAPQGLAVETLSGLRQKIPRSC